MGCKSNTLVEIDGSQITDWGSFHDVFAEAFGFLEGYGRNLDAWVDCMSSLDEDFNKIRIEPGETVTLQITNADALKASNPEILQTVFELTSFVNYRRVDTGDLPIIVVSANL